MIKKFKFMGTKLGKEKKKKKEKKRGKGIIQFKATSL